MTERNIWTQCPNATTINILVCLLLSIFYAFKDNWDHSAYVCFYSFLFFCLFIAFSENTWFYLLMALLFYNILIYNLFFISFLLYF